MAKSMKRLFDGLPAGEWVCWDRPPVMYVCYNSDVCSYYPMDTGLEYHGPFPLFSWEYALATDGRGGLYVTGGHDENRQVRVEDPYSVNHKPPFPDSFFGPMVSELWRYDVRENAWEEVRQEAWGPRQCIAARHMVYVPDDDVLVRTGACREGHSPRPPVPLRGWGLFGIWVYDIPARRWRWMQPSERLGPMTCDTSRRLVLACREGRVSTYDVHTNTLDRRPQPDPAPQGEGAFAYDRAHDLCLFYGENGETWTYDIDANAWTNRKPRPAPKVRPRFAFALDPETGTALLFGGRAPGKQRHPDDTWTYDVESNTWTRIDCPMHPEGRFWAGPGMVFDETNRAFLLYGGLAKYHRVDARFAPGDVWVFKLPRDPHPRAGAPLRSRPEPGLPRDLLVSVTGPEAVDITWSAVPGAAGYRLRRVRVMGDDRFAAEKVIEVGASTAYRDTPPGLPKRHYQYTVQAVNSEGVAGGWSAPAGTIPSAPTKLEMTPNADRRSITLRWPANPEQGIVGYNLYRWVEPPFRFAFKEEPELITPAWWEFDENRNPPERMQWIKVNDEPIQGTRYVDKGLKRVTTWYYIRAVNALGVEGHYRTTYSMPVWRWYAKARQFF